MNLATYPILKSKLPDLNERELTSHDFEMARIRERILNIIRPYPKPFTSCFIPRQVGGTIITAAYLTPIERQFYEWYELARFWLHSPRLLSEYNKKLRPEKDMFEAEALALMAMFPQRDFHNHIYGFEFRRGFVAEKIQKRVNLLHNFGR